MSIRTVLRSAPPPLAPTAAAIFMTRLQSISTVEDAAEVHATDRGVVDSQSPSSSSSSSPRVQVSSAEGSVSPLLVASRRAVDPYEGCKCQLDLFVELHSEQVALVRQLQNALSTVGSEFANAGGGDNDENVHPGSLSERRVGFRAAEHNGTLPCAAVGAHCNSEEEADSTLAATPSAIVYRLRVLQHESAELAHTRCYPALRHLLSTFDAYWSWKQANIDRDEGDGHRQQSQHTFSQASNVGSQKEETTRESTTNVAAPFSAVLPSPSSFASSLRQRYDHVVRVRDELESFLELHREAVGALEPHLQQWKLFSHREGVRPSTVSRRPSTSQVQSGTHARQQCMLYVQELLEVTLTTLHVARLLQAAVAALCRPSPRQEERIGAASRQEGTQQTSSRGSIGSGGSGTALQQRGGKQANMERSRLIEKAGIIGNINKGNGKANSDFIEQPDVSLVATCDASKGSSASPSTPSKRSQATQQVRSSSTTPPTRSQQMPVQAQASWLERGRAGDAWLGALSPLTPTPPLHSSTKTAGEGREASPLARSSSRSNLAEKSSPLPRDPEGGGRHTRRRAPSTEDQHGSRDVSLSTTAAVSVSPMTAVRLEAASGTSSLHRHSESSSPSPSQSTALTNTSLQQRSAHPCGATTAATTTCVARASPPSSFVRPNSRDTLRDGAGFVSAAVSPPAVLQEEMRMASVRTSRGSSQDNDSVRIQRARAHNGEGVRSLLSELASVQGDDADEAEHLSGASPHKKTQQEAHLRGTSLNSRGRDEEEEKEYDAEASAAVYIPVDVLRSASPRSPTVLDIYTHESAGLAASEELHSGDQPRRSVDGRGVSGAAEDELAAGSVGRAASIPSLWWPRLPSASTSAAAKANESDDDGREGSSSNVGNACKGEEVADVLASMGCSDLRITAEKSTSLAAHNSPACMPSSSAADRRRAESISFYTSSSTLTSEPKEERPSASASRLHASEEDTRIALAGVAVPTSSVLSQQAKAAAAASAAATVEDVEVEALERQAEEIEAKLQQVSRQEAHRRPRRWVPSRSPSGDLNTSFSSLPSSPTSSPTRRGRSSRSKRLGGTERRLTRTLRRELEEVREEQHRSLQRMQRDMRDALDKVVSAAASIAASSRASSRHSNDAADGERTKYSSCGDRSEHRHPEEPVAEMQKVTKDGASPGLRGDAAKCLVSPQPRDAHAAPSFSDEHSHSTEDAGEAEALRASLAAAQARAARLEQQTIQLKKRLWLAEFSDSAKGHDDAVCEAPGQRHVSLRDAFVYGSVSGGKDAFGGGDAAHENKPGGATAARSMRNTDADGALAEEQALLYLVDHALADRRSKRGGTLRVSESLFTPSQARPFLSPPEPSMAAVSTTAHSSKEESPSPLKRFDDDNDGVWRQGQGQLPYLSVTRSPQIRQQRASIFERLRLSLHAPKASPPDEKGISAVIVEGQTGTPSALNAAAPKSEERRKASMQLSPPPPMKALSSNALASDAAAPAAPAHPYSSTKSGGSALHVSPTYMGAEVHGDFAGGDSRSRRRSGNASPYYAAISDSNSGQSLLLNTQDDRARSSLRAEQVLQNARRLLQHRGDAHDRPRVDTDGYGYCREEEGEDYAALYGGARRVADAYQRPDGHVRAAENSVYAADFSVPSQWKPTRDMRGPPSSSSTPPPPYSALTRTMTSTTPTTATQSPVAHRPRDDRPCRDARESSPDHHTSGNAAPVGGLRSPSAEVRAYRYDASPCPAVAYSSSKVPRTSSPGHRGGNHERHNDGTADSEGDRSAGKNSGRCAYVRVDSATSPIPSPPRSRLHDPLADSAVRAVRNRVPVISADQTQQLARSRTSSFQRSGSRPQQPPRGTALHDVTGDYRRRFSSSELGSRDETDSENEEDEEVEDVPADRASRSRNRPPQQVGRRHSSTSQSRGASRATSTSSHGSAQEELLDKLIDQEALLQRALAQLHTQQQQLHEKRRQVAQFASARGLTRAQSGRQSTALNSKTKRGGSAAGAPAQLDRAGKGPTYAALAQTVAPRQDSSADEKKIAALLDRLASAEVALAERETRIRQAMAVVRRQKNALESDDFL